MMSAALPRLAGAALALATCVGPAMAASPDARVVAIPPGAVVLVLQPGAMPMLAPPGFADPFAMLRQVDQMMQQSFAGPAPDRLIEAAMRQMQSGTPMSGMMVTTVSNGRSSCTRQVIYSGDPSAPKIDVRTSGNGCASDSTPAALPAAPEAIPARQALPRTLRVERTRSTPIQVAQLDQ